MWLLSADLLLEIAPNFRAALAGMAFSATPFRVISSPANERREFYVHNPAVVGVDVAKHVFQVHGVSTEGETLFNRKLRRAEVKDFFSNLQPCLVAIEACGTAYHWAREIAACGHDVKLVPAQLVTAFVPRGKTDANDAVAITEAVNRKSIRFVPIKTPEQQSLAVLHRVRDLLVRQRTRVVNAARSHLAEFGIAAKLGQQDVERMIALVRDGADTGVPEIAQFALEELGDEITTLNARIDRVDKRLQLTAKADPDARRLMTIPGVGVLTALAIRAFVPDPGSFTSARHFAAWLGLTPKLYSSGGKSQSRGISKMGNAALRQLLFTGATSAIAAARRTGNMSEWLRRLLERKPKKVATVAFCNKMARMIWALLTKGGAYRPPLSQGAILDRYV
jgi:transposase